MHLRGRCMAYGGVGKVGVKAENQPVLAFMIVTWLVPFYTHTAIMIRIDFKT